MKLRLLLLALFILFLCGAGCNKGDEKKKVVKPITVLVFVDHSDSIRSYPAGGLQGIQKDYYKIAEQYLKRIIDSRDSVKVEVREFVKKQEYLFRKEVETWEKIRGPLRRELEKEPYPESEESKTLFSALISGLRDRCKEQANRDVYALVLTDGHPDEPWADIQAAAKAFAKDDPGNLLNLTIGPVEPDMKFQWRKKLGRMLAPLGEGVVNVVNHEDYKTGIAQALGGLE